MSDTIAALATPAGRSGIGVIRLSGNNSHAYAARLCNEPTLELPPRHAALKTLVDIETGEPIDEAVLLYFKGPNSFTGEDVVEISCHGSPTLLRQVIDACLRLGARMAEAGEFTLRALANGRMNLEQAEAVRDLIDARTAESARQAVRQLRGEFSNRLQPIKDKLLDTIVVLESALEFVEDDLPASQTDRLRDDLSGIAVEIGRIASTFKAGRLLREGLKVTLAGRPNVGKSSLFNALLGMDRAIVTEIAGTTRDHINEDLSIDGVPISLMDTAGLRDTTDTVESIGVERSRRAVADADLVIVVIDAAEPLESEDIGIIESVRGIQAIIAVNKIDKIDEAGLDGLLDTIREIGDRSLDALLNSETTTVHARPLIPVSAKTGAGLDRLRAAFIDPFITAAAVNIEAANSGESSVSLRSTATGRAGSAAFGTVSADTGFLVTDARHHDLLIRAREEVLNSISLLDQNASEELTLVGLHNALRFLGQITGETTPEDMLTRIFSTFCIGK